MPPREVLDLRLEAWATLFQTQERPCERCGAVIPGGAFAWQMRVCAPAGQVALTVALCESCVDMLFPEDDPAARLARREEQP